MGVEEGSYLCHSTEEAVLNERFMEFRSTFTNENISSLD
jgi:hypothetical protein